MIYSDNPSPATWEKLLQRPAADVSQLEPVVLPLLRDVKERGDEALREYTRKFDQAEFDHFLVNEEEIIISENLLDLSLKEAIQIARNNIERFHISQHTGVTRVE